MNKFDQDVIERLARIETSMENLTKVVDLHLKGNGVGRPLETARLWGVMQGIGWILPTVMATGALVAVLVQ